MLSEELLKIAKELMDLYDQAYRQIKPEVDFIIKNHIEDVKKIDACLEQMLNIPTEKCYQLFIKLCTYYQTFNEYNANEYLKLYDELYGEEEKIIKKKTK